MGIKASNRRGSAASRAGLRRGNRDNRQTLRDRGLRIEQLESRCLLSVNPLAISGTGITQAAAISLPTLTASVGAAIKAPPSILQQPKITVQTSTGASLSVLGADTVNGEKYLAYTWFVTSPPGATPPTFSNNGSNGARTPRSFSTRPVPTRSRS